MRDAWIEKLYEYLDLCVNICRYPIIVRQVDKQEDNFIYEIIHETKKSQVRLKLKDDCVHIISNGDINNTYGIGSFCRSKELFRIMIKQHTKLGVVDYELSENILLYDQKAIRRNLMEQNWLEYGHIKAT